MKIKQLRYSLLMGLLTLLGFGSCSGIRMLKNNPPAAEYGVPHADFRVVGEVRDQSGRPLSGVRVVIAPDGLRPQALNDTLYTNADGKYEKTINRYYPLSRMVQDIEVKFEDIDGESGGGAYRSAILDQSGINVQQITPGDGKWYEGEFILDASPRLEPVFIDVVEYGVPHATFRLIGNVTDANGNPVPDIRIAASMKGQPEGAYIEENGKMVPYVWERKDTLFTNAEGEYMMEYTMFATDMEGIPESVTVTAEDIDKKANGGEFKPVKGQSAEVVKASEGKRRWDEGTYEARADFKLKRK